MADSYITYRDADGVVWEVETDEVDGEHTVKVVIEEEA